MHEYAACPSQERRNTVGGGERTVTPHDGQHIYSDTTDNYDDVSVRSSLEMRYPGQGTPPPAPVELSHASSHPAPAIAPESSKPDSTNFSGSAFSKLSTAWRLQTIITGCYILAWLLAIAHYCFFVYLDGRVPLPGVPIPNKTTTIPQGYVTAISLIFTTAFRASLVTSVGVCYTQHLWATLRDRVMKISLVEDLFQMRTSVFHLMSRSVYIKTPVLAAVAVFCWIVPLITIYPPSALSVEVRTLPIRSRLNVSTFYVEKDVGIDFACNVALDDLDQDEVQNCNAKRPLSEGSYDTKYITRSCLISGDISSISPSVEGNISYALDFWGPDLECERTNRTVERLILESDLMLGLDRDPTYPDTWQPRDFGTYTALRTNIDTNLSLYIPVITFSDAEKRSEYSYYPCLDGINGGSAKSTEPGQIDLPETGIRVISPFRNTVCRPKIVKYAVTFNYTGGRQQISCEIGNEDHFPQYWADSSFFKGSYEDWVQQSDALVVYGDFARNLNRSYTRSRRPNFEYPTTNQAEPAGSYTTEDGTIVDTCLLHAKTVELSFSEPENENYEIWPLSVFVRRAGPSDPYDPTFHFDMNLARELLINSTISMLAQNRQFQIVDGQTTDAFNVYHFHNKLAFFLPYGICLALGIPIIALGLFAFYVRNQRVSAITGGFLQILMTTRGHGAIDRAVTKEKGSLGGWENVSSELEGLRVRFGEVIDGRGLNGGQSVSEVSDPAAHDMAYPSGKSNLATGVEAREETAEPLLRATFGTPEEVRRLQRRGKELA